MSIASRIQARLDAIGVSASRASLDAGLSRSAVADIIAGNSESPRVATLEALAPVLQCSIAHLVTGQAAAPVGDGGPAFPGGDMVDEKDRGPVAIFAPGMSLRDWFAGQALASFVPDTPQNKAEAAYAIADAMLAERSKAGEKQ